MKGHIVCVLGGWFYGVYLIREDWQILMYIKEGEEQEMQ